MTSNPSDGLSFSFCAQSNSNIFIDTNVLVYGITRKSGECNQLLERCARQDVFGVVSFDVLLETTHRLMLAEAFDKGLITKEMANLLRPAHISQLSDYWKNVEAILQLNLLIVGIDEDLMRAAQTVRAKAQLKTIDSVIVACMQDLGVTALASNDGEFERASGITVYKPSDV